MVTRTRKATVTTTPAIETIAPESATLNERLHAMLDDALSEDLPSWKRQVIAWVLSLAAAGAVGYAIGTIIGYIVVGAVLLSGSAFIAMTLYFIGVLCAMYAGSKVSAFVYNNVMDKTIDAQFAKASNALSNGSNAVRQWFSSRKEVQYA